MKEMAHLPSPKEIFSEFKNYKNPLITADIEIVWVVSGHDTFDGSQATSVYSLPSISAYHGEDRQRILKGVELVKKITAKRLNKNLNEVTTHDISLYGPYFFYNGVFRQNQILKNASPDDFPLPKDKVIIEEITPVRDPTPQQANTKTQFEKFPHRLLQKLMSGKAKMAVVTNRYHLPRVRRQVEAPSIIKREPLWHEIKVDFFAADDLKKPKAKTSRHKNAAFILQNIKSETAKIASYTKKGDLTPNPEQNS